MEVLEKFYFGRNFDLGTNPPYLGDDDSNGTLDFQKLQMKVRKGPYIYWGKIMFLSGKRLKAHNAL